MKRILEQTHVTKLEQCVFLARVRYNLLKVFLFFSRTERITSRKLLLHSQDTENKKKRSKCFQFNVINLVSLHNAIIFNGIKLHKMLLTKKIAAMEKWQSSI